MLTDGRPTIAMETYVRLMVLKQRYRWGYRSLMAEVSDSIHLRRFCRIRLSERVPDDSTVRKLTRRIGPDTVNEITRVLIVQATRSKRFRPQGREDRFDGDRGGREVPDRFRARFAWRPRARARGSQAREAGQGTEAAGAGSLAVDGSHAPGGDPHDPSPLGGGEGRGAEADSADRRAAGAVDRRDPATGRDRAPAGARARREGEAARQPRSSSSSQTAARRSQRRSSSASPGSRSRTGWCRWPTRTRGRSARGSWASRTNLGTWRNCAK